MKQKDIRIGGEYLTKIGEKLCRVIVVAERPDSFSGRMRFLVRRAGEDRVLPKSRSASALREFSHRSAVYSPQVIPPVEPKDSLEGAAYNQGSARLTEMEDRLDEEMFEAAKQVIPPVDPGSHAAVCARGTSPEECDPWYEEAEG